MTDETQNNNEPTDETNNLITPEMTEDSTESLSPEIESTEEQQSPPEVLDKAKKYGYKTKEQWVAEGKDPNKFKSPEEFTKFGDNWDALQSLRSELKAMRNENASLIEYQKRAAENAVRIAREELAMKLQYAKQNGNVQAVENLTKQQVEMDIEVKQQAMDQIKRAQDDVNAQFIERNSYWYNDNHPDLQNEAQQRATRIFSVNPGISYEACALQVEQEMKWSHPDLGSARQVAKAPTHIPASRSNMNKANAVPETGMRNLTPDQQEEYKEMKTVFERNHINDKARPGVPKYQYTVADYIKASTPKTQLR